MPTIDQLAPATASSDTDEFVVSQNGIARSITRAQVLAGTQPQLSVPSGALLGGPSTGNGGPEQISIGANLTLVSGTLSATASPYVMSALPVGNVPASTDTVPIAQSGSNVVVTYSQFVGGLPGVANIDGSQLLVTATGSTAHQRLADFAASTLPMTGGTLTGSLDLAGDPSTALQATTKEYVDTRVLRSGDTLTGPLLLAADPSAAHQAATKNYVDARISRSGDTMTGPLILSADPTAALGATTKEYTDNQFAKSLSLVGGTMAGPITLAANPTTSLQAIPKQYVDSQVATTLPLAGGTLSGALLLATNPYGEMQAATKLYVDSQIATALPLTGGTVSGSLFLAGAAMTGPLTLVANPITILQAAPKQYVDSQVATALPLTGGTLGGGLTLAANPSGTMQAATKQYVDSQIASALPPTGGTVSASLLLAGGTMIGPLTLAANPTTTLQAASKQYVDGQVTTALPLDGGSLSGPLTLASAPTNSLQAATKSYADAKVQKSGDTMTGPLTMIQSFTGSSVPTMLSATRTQSAIGDGALVNSSMTLTFTGGVGSSNANTLLTTNIGSTLNSGGAAVDGPGTDVYSFVSYLNSSALRPLGVSTIAARHFSIQSAPTRILPPGGVPVGRQMAQLWALWLPIVDQTNLPSSISNSLFGNETDLQANNVDDINSRVGLMLAATEAIPLASGGYPLEWAYGITTSTSATAQFKWMAYLQGNYSIAVIDTRNAFPNGTGGAAPTVTSSLASPATNVHVSNVMPFTSAGTYGLPVSTSNTAQVKIGADTYIQTGYRLDGPGLQSGILTLSTPVSVADGVAGSLLSNSSRTIWLATGHQIAFDYAGAITAFYDASISALHFTTTIAADGGLLFDHKSGTSLLWNSTAFSPSGGAYLQGNLMITGTLYTSSSFVVGGTTNFDGSISVNATASFYSASSFQSSVSMSSGLTISAGTLVAKGNASISGSLSVGGGAIGLPIYTVATLPSAALGSLAYATNGRKTGEAAGAGTGVLVVEGSGGQWMSVMAGTAVLS